MLAWTRIAAFAISVVSAAAAAQAERLRDFDGPAEFPPADYQGRQFVDSNGCVFVRAGVGDATTWVPRVTRDRQVICGQRPTIGSGNATRQPRQGTARLEEPVLQPRPEPSAAAPRRVAVPAPAPRVAGASAARPRAVVPEGYKRVWDDGRLNPNRGLGSAAGQAAMDRLWTSTVPRRMTDGGKELVARVTRQVARTPTVSTRSASRRRAEGAAARYVQVGTFGQSANARRLAHDLQRAGLPARIARGVRGGRHLEIVLAGPFADRDALLGALARVRGMGFEDAFPRR